MLINLNIGKYKKRFEFLIQIEIIRGGDIKKMKA
jgi:hypothetical protein